MISFGILSVSNYPFLNTFLRKLNYLDIFPKVIIFDKKLLSKDDINRFALRTGKQIEDFDYFEQNKSAIPVFEVNNHNNEFSLKKIKDLDLHFLVNLGTPRILNQKIIESTRFGVLNCHPGILPFFKGCCCVEWAIYHDKPLGNTIHWMDQGIDTGPIIDIKSTRCFKSDSYEDIRKRVYLDGIDLITDFIKRFNNKLDEKYLKGVIHSGGNYFKPMEDTLLNNVKNRIKFKQYKYQI